MRRSFFFPALFLAIAASAQAQPCGPLTFSFSGTGAGCAPFGGVPPTLAGALLPVPTPPICSVRFTLTPAPALALAQVGVLVIGATNPMLNLGPYGYPACTALASLDVFLFLAPGPISGTLSLAIPISPSTTFLGLTTFQQGGLVQAGLAGLTGFLSNGVRMDIS